MLAARFTKTQMADAFALAAHSAIGQRRKYTGEPYIVHPRAVWRLVAETLPDDVDAQVAAYLHDVVEDTKVTIEVVGHYFGGNVAALVEWLTDRTTPAHGNRARRREIGRQKLCLAPAAAQTIKVADLIDNTKTIVEFDEDFARVYLAEKASLLDVMTKADDHLVGIARGQIEAGICILGTVPATGE